MEETKENVANTPEEVTSAANPEAEEYYAQLQRVMADFDNYRKRVVKEKDAQYSVILSEVITEFLPVIDNLEKSLETNADDEVSKAWKNGVELIYRQFTEVLNKLGAEEIKAVGEQFDPNFHDAVMHVEDENVGDNVIVEELRKGYKLKDRIIRHSMVKVAN
ncbi:MAG: nucleotide exchange factor GrpE [Clostridiales bacterium]|nr:nucleotide exchange factor GrpE [Clostridiales bacterium]